MNDTIYDFYFYIVSVLVWFHVLQDSPTKDQEKTTFLVWTSKMSLTLQELHKVVSVAGRTTFQYPAICIPNVRGFGRLSLSQILQHI